MSTRAAVIVVLLATFTACSDGAVEGPSDTALPVSPATGAEASDRPATGGWSSTVPNGSTGPSSGTDTTVTASGSSATTAPTVSGAATTTPDDTGVDDGSGTPPRPAGCVDGPAGPEVVLVVDADEVRLLDGTTPTCLRLQRAQRVRVTSTAPFGTAVSIGASTTWLPSGGEVLGSVLGDRYPVGALVDVRIDVLATTVTVQVVP